MVLIFLCVIIVIFSAAPALAIERDEKEYNYPTPSLINIDMAIQPSHYLKMINTKEKKKYPAAVSIDGGSATEIGVKLRGSTSLDEGFDSRAKRMPMELCFDYADPGGEYNGNPSLKLVNTVTPAQLILQYAAMQAYEFMGIPTPRAYPAFIRINETDYGLYLAVEDVNEAFVKENFGGGSLFRRDDPKEEDSGNKKVRLIKYDFENYYMKVTGEHAALDGYQKAVSRGSGVENYIDVDEFLRYLACEAFVYNEDGFFGGADNFYFCECDGILTLVPWDVDRVFAIPPGGSDLDEFYLRASSPVRMLLENEEYKQRYENYIRLLNDEFLNPDTFLPWLEGFIKLIEPYVERDASSYYYTDASQLTQGSSLYDSVSGNLLLTFGEYHKYIAAQLDNREADYPQYEGFSADKYKIKDDPSLPDRICENYRKTEQGGSSNEHKNSSQTVIIGGVFAAVFALTIVSVYAPWKLTVRKNRKSEE